jgi:hypothetical protein
MYEVAMATVKIEISGAGGEFQHHYLSVKELKEIIDSTDKKDLSL